MRPASAPAFAAIALLAATGAASAEEPAVCYGITTLNSPEFVEPHLKIVSPSAAKKLFFAKNGYDRKGCPDAGERCSTGAYVVAGDPVIVGATVGGHACATFVGRKPAAALTQGWLASALLSDPTPAAPKPADWVGSWRSGDERQIAAKQADGQLNLVGDATWGASDPQRVANGGVNTGSFEVKVKPEGASVGFGAGFSGETLPLDDKDAFCKVRLWRLGPYLVAADNGGCGGANVTFSGVYRRD